MTDLMRKVKNRWDLYQMNRFILLWLYALLSYIVLQFFHSEFSLSILLGHVVTYPKAVLLSTSIIYLVGLFMWMVTNRFILSTYVMMLGSFVIGTISAIKLEYRGEPLYPSDLMHVSDVPALLDMIRMGHVLLFVGILAVFSFFVYRLKFRQKRPLPSLVRVVLIGSLVFIFAGVYRAHPKIVSALDSNCVEWIAFDQRGNYTQNGFVAGFLYNLNMSPMSEEALLLFSDAKELYAKYAQAAEEINTQRDNDAVNANVIYVMNESLMDPMLLEASNKEFDPIPTIREVSEEHSGGYMLSQGYGGGTANIEFEALTSVSMEPLNAGLSTPYVQMLPSFDTFPSIISRLKNMGHSSLAIHPFSNEMYRRVENYSMLGFNSFYYKDSMKFLDYTGHFISDQSAYKETIYRMDETDTYDFVHLVTMQNHLPYEDKYTQYPSEKDTGYEKDRVNQYYQDLLHTDEAFGYLYSHVMEMDEPTIVVFWGDHWPHVFDESRADVGNRLKYMTPSVIFSNLDYDVEEWDVISPMYFANGVLSAANAKVSPFDALLLSLYDELPAFEKGHYFSSVLDEIVEQRSALPDSTLDLLLEYDQVIYDVTMGSDYLSEMGFFEPLIE